MSKSVLKLITDVRQQALRDIELFTKFGSVTVVNGRSDDGKLVGHLHNVVNECNAILGKLEDMAAD